MFAEELLLLLEKYHMTRDIPVYFIDSRRGKIRVEQKEGLLTIEVAFKC